MAQRFRPGKSSSSDAQPSSSAYKRNDAAISDTEMSETEPKEAARRASMDKDYRTGEGLNRSSSTKGFALKTKPSFSFRRKGSKPSSTSPAIRPAPDQEKVSPLMTGHATSSATSGAPNIRSPPSHTGNGPTPTSAQSAYIQRILGGPPGNHDAADPLQRLKQANDGNGESTETVSDSGLVESLKAFTAVEVLEGENAFACKRCWKVKTGKYKSTQATVQEEDEDVIPAVSLSASPARSTVDTNLNAMPLISIVDSNESIQPVVSDSRSTSSAGVARPPRTPSPLRHSVDNERNSLTAGQSTSLPSAETDVPADPESDGLSDTDTSDELPPAPKIPVVRPKMPSRKKSSHYVMSRAFKRLFIAKAPETLVFHFKRFRQSQKMALITSFSDLKKCVVTAISGWLLTAVLRMDDYISFPETLDLAPFMAPNRNDFKVVQTPSGPRAPYMDWTLPEHSPELDPVFYRLYGNLFPISFRC